MTAPAPPRCDLCGWSGVQPRKFCGKCAALLSMVELEGWAGPTAVELRTIAHNILGEGFEPRRVAVDVGHDYGRRPGIRVMVFARDRRRKNVYMTERLLPPELVDGTARAASLAGIADLVTETVRNLATSLADQVPQAERRKPAPAQLERPGGRR